MILWLVAVFLPGFLLPDHWAYLRSIAPWVGLALFSFVTWHFLWPHLSSRQVAKDPDSKSGYTRIIAPTGLRLQGATSSVTLAWDRIARVVETPEFFLFYFGRKTAYYLPQRAVSPELLRDLRTRLHQVLGPSKLTLRANAS